MLGLSFVNNTKVTGADALFFEARKGRAFATFACKPRSTAAKTLSAEEGLELRHDVAGLTTATLARLAAERGLSAKQRKLLGDALALSRDRDAAQRNRDGWRAVLAEKHAEIERLRANARAVGQHASEDIVELYTIRETLEALVARLAARRVGPGDPERIRAVLEDMRRAVAEERWLDLHYLDLDFHHVIRAMAGNRYIDRSLSQVENAVRRFRDTTYLLPGRAQESLKEHEELGEAIIARDAARAEQLASEHMRRVAELRMRMLLDGF